MDALLLIDGYNLLHSAGVFVESGPPTLERSRAALLDALLERLPAKLAARTIVAFDAEGAPPGLPREISHRGLAVRFARRGRSADDLLEELIAAAADPRNVTVVSSDHRVQRAARQRGTAFIDSERWWHELRQHSAAADPTDEKSAAPPGNPFPPGYARDLFR